MKIWSSQRLLQFKQSQINPKKISRGSVQICPKKMSGPQRDSNLSKYFTGKFAVA